MAWSAPGRSAPGRGEITLFALEAAARAGAGAGGDQRRNTALSPGFTRGPAAHIAAASSASCAGSPLCLPLPAAAAAQQCPNNESWQPGAGDRRCGPGVRVQGPGTFYAAMAHVARIGAGAWVLQRIWQPRLSGSRRAHQLRHLACPHWPRAQAPRRPASEAQLALPTPHSTTADSSSFASQLARTTHGAQRTPGRSYA
jgi:hypothetical protein